MNSKNVIEHNEIEIVVLIVNNFFMAITLKMIFNHNMIVRELKNFGCNNDYIDINGERFAWSEMIDYHFYYDDEYDEEIVDEIMSRYIK